MADAQTSTASAALAQEQPKQSIAQKVEALQARKTVATSEMNAAPEGAEKTALQEEIAVIDRKLRWYAGRSSEGKPKTARPSKGTSRKSQKAASAAAPAPQPEPANPVANES